MRDREALLPRHARLNAPIVEHPDGHDVRARVVVRARRGIAIGQDRADRAPLLRKPVAVEAERVHELVLQAVGIPVAQHHVADLQRAAEAMRLGLADDVARLVQALEGGAWQQLDRDVVIGLRRRGPRRQQGEGQLRPARDPRQQRRDLAAQRLGPPVQDDLHRAGPFPHPGRPVVEWAVILGQGERVEEADEFRRHRLLHGLLEGARRKGRSRYCEQAANEGRDKATQTAVSAVPQAMAGGRPAMASH